MHLFLSTTGLCLAVALFIDYYVLTEEHKTKLKTYLMTWYQTATVSNRLQLLYNNFLLLEHVGDNVFGKKLISKEVVNQTVLLTCSFLTITLSLALLPINGGLKLSPKPWEMVSFIAQACDKVSDDANSHPEKYKFQTPQIAHAAITITKSIGTLDQPKIRAEFTFLCIICFWLLGIMLNLISVIVSRWLLRELVQSKGILIMIPSLIFCLTLIIVLSSLGLLLLCEVFLMPISFFQGWLLFASFKVSIYLGLWLLITFVLAAWAFSTLWMKYLILVPMIPLAGLGFTILFTVLTAPWRNRVYFYINKVILWIFSHKHGPLAVIAATLCIFFQTLTVVADCLGWK